MPIRIRWRSKENIPFALMILGGCGLFQVLFIFIAQYLLRVGNYIMIILIPFGAIIGLYFGTTMVFEAFAQEQRRRKLKTQFQKLRLDFTTIQRFLDFPVVKPLLIMFIIFSPLFFITYYVTLYYLGNIISFLVAEIFSTLICLLIANLIEKKYGKVKRY